MADNLQGAAKLLQQLKDIGALDNGRAMSTVVRAGMQPTLKRARDNAPESQKPHKTYTGKVVEPGFGAKSLHIVTTSKGAANTYTALLGPTKEAFYMTQFVERGTRRAPAHPFLVPALYASMDECSRALVTSMNAYLEKKAKS